MSRREITAYEPLENEVCISITDPGSPPARVSPRFLDVLRVCFHDIPSERVARASDTQFSEGLACLILGFASRWSHAARLVVHCEQGQSRSPAVALALWHLAGHDTQALEERFPGWNRRVRAVLARVGESNRKAGLDA